MADQEGELGTSDVNGSVDGQERDPVNGEEQLQSYAGVSGEWETRQISIMGVVKRFISQLSYGQDLTKISMPSEFFEPIFSVGVCFSALLDEISDIARGQLSVRTPISHVACHTLVSCESSRSKDVQEALQSSSL